MMRTDAHQQNRRMANPSVNCQLSILQWANMRTLSYLVTWRMTAHVFLANRCVQINGKINNSLFICALILPIIWCWWHWPEIDDSTPNHCKKNTRQTLKTIDTQQTETVPQLKLHKPKNKNHLAWYSSKSSTTLGLTCPSPVDMLKHLWLMWVNFQWSFRKRWGLKLNNLHLARCQSFSHQLFINDRFGL